MNSRIAPILGGVLASLVLAACGGKPSVREPAELVDIEKPAFKPQRLWGASAGNGGDGRVSALRLRLESDALYTADIEGRVFAYAPDSGKLLWRADTGSRVYAGPSVAGDSIYLGTRDAEVIALKRADGSERWRKAMSSEVLGPPATEGAVLVTRTLDGRIYGLGTSSGERLWSFDRLVPSLVLRASSAPLLAGGQAFIGMDNGRVVSLRVADGQPLWEQPVAVPAGRTELERLTDVDGDLLEVSGCVAAASFGGEVACLAPGTGEVVWRRAIRSYNSMAASDEMLFVTDEAGVVWALDQRSGAAAWKQEALSWRRLSPPAYVDGYVVVGDFEGYLHWIDAGSGRIVARSRLGSDPILLQPVVGNGTVFVASSTGRLAALTPGTTRP